jgi:hypothetical protein
VRASEDRRARSLVRLYERRLHFEVVARRRIGGDDVIVMLRRPSPVDSPGLRTVR